MRSLSGRREPEPVKASPGGGSVDCSSREFLAIENGHHPGDWLKRRTDFGSASIQVRRMPTPRARNMRLPKCGRRRSSPARRRRYAPPPVVWVVCSEPDSQPPAVLDPAVLKEPHRAARSGGLSLLAVTVNRSSKTTCIRPRRGGGSGHYPASGAGRASDASLSPILSPA
jgi:hypothetical protein